jgi:hypothetical protein
MSDDNEKRAAEQAAGLRALADMIEANPRLEEVFRYAFNQIDVFVGKASDPKTEMADLIRVGMSHGAKVDKRGSDVWMTAILRFGPVELHVNGHREEVCERIVTGVETVTKTVKDPEALAAVPEIEVTEEVEKVEWRCSPLMAAEGVSS